MKLRDISTKHKVLLAGLILLITLSLTAASLFRFPVFYEQSPTQRIRTFLLGGLLFFMLTVVGSLRFVLPHVKKTLTKKNLLFTIPLAVLLTFFLVTTSANYWAMPEVHAVEICFEAYGGTGTVIIQEFVDPNTNRLYPPNSFGADRYPIKVGSGECVSGRIMMLISPLTQALIGYQVTATIEENPPDGRLAIEINNSPSVVYFAQNSEEGTSTEIVLKDGFDNGTELKKPWGEIWLLGLKLIAAVISASFIALFLSTLTEEVFSSSAKNNGRPHG